MTGEVGYDNAHEAALTPVKEESVAMTEGFAAPVDGLGCHSGATKMEAAARAAGNSELLDQYAADYPFIQVEGEAGNRSGRRLHVQQLTCGRFW